MTKIFSVCCSDEWGEWIKEKNISPSDCFKRGIKIIMFEKFHITSDEQITKESWKAKAEQIQRTMGGYIEELNKKIEELSNAPPVVSFQPAESKK